MAPISACEQPSKIEIKKKHVLALTFGFLYALSSVSETLAIKALNYAPEPITLPIYTSLLSNQLWIFMLPVYIYMYLNRVPVKETGVKRNKTVDYIIQYTVLGILTFLITVFRNFSVNAIPGSVFLLLISTSIVFNMILSVLWLKKSFNYWHIGAAALCLSSATVIGVISVITDTASPANYALGIPTAIASAFFVAVMNVAQEYIQPFWDDFTFRAIEMAVITSMIASALIVTLGTFVVKEMITWATVFTAISVNSHSLVLIICVSVALPIIKLVIRSSKYSTIQYSNAFFFEFVQSSASLLGSLANILIFGEPWGHGYIAAIVLMALSYGVYIQAKNVSKKATVATQQKTVIIIDNPIEIEMTMVRGWK